LIFLAKLIGVRQKTAREIGNAVRAPVEKKKRQGTPKIVLQLKHNTGIATDPAQTCLWNNPTVLPMPPFLLGYGKKLLTHLHSLVWYNYIPSTLLHFSQ
jgi:hypothetical protein